MNNILEIYVNGKWVKVSPYIHRSWTGSRRKNGETWHGPVFVLGTNKVTQWN